MRVLRKDEYKLLEQLVSLSQKSLHKTLSTYLGTKYSNVIVDEKYIVAIGNIPIALVAHMDTVFKYPVENMYYDSQKNVVWSPEGLGADDRAGIFAILQIIKTGLRPSIILTTDEETGAIGATALSKAPCPIPNLKYMIQLDRRGTNDCVFYDCYNPTFVDYVEKFGFEEHWGTFSDISVLMPAWKICGVNLSVGYEDEHSVSEVLHVKPLLSTIAKVTNMLRETDIPNFEFKELDTRNWYKSYLERDLYDEKFDYGMHCGSCKNLYSEYELYPVKSSNNSVKFFCPDCLVERVKWCKTCGEAFEPASSAFNDKCSDCAKLGGKEKCTAKSKSNSNK